MKHLLLSLLLLFAFTACDSKEKQAEHDAKIAQQAKAELMAELKTKEEAKKKARLEAEKNATKLEKVGIKVEGSKIIIDTNKTKTFFKKMTQKLETKMKKIQKDLEKGRLEDNETGIKIDETKINIDLNKTKGFLETWGKKMQEIVQDIDQMAREVEPAISPKQPDNTAIPNKKGY